MGNLSQNFSRWEFACKCGCGYDTADIELVEVLEDLRKEFDAPIKINSACRCVEHNKKQGGGKKSQHLFGKAADIVVAGVHADIVASHLERKYPDKYGIGHYKGRTHVDVRPSLARWDNR